MQLKSHVTGIDWLPICNPSGATQISLLHQLEQSEWLTDMQLKTLQFQQLFHLITQARKYVPYYQSTLHSLPSDLHPLTLQNLWQEIPILNRSQLQENTDDLTSQSIPKEHGKTVWASTSGSTGLPVKVLLNELTQEYWSAITLRDHFWHDRDLKGKLAAIRYFKDQNYAQPPEGQTLAYWSSNTSNIYVNGPSCCLSIHSPITAQAEWLTRENPDYLVTFPSNLHALARYFQSQALKLPNLKQIQTVSEVLDDTTRQLCADFFEVPICDTYSAVETGYLALQCPEHEHYHVQSEVAYLEIVNEQRRPCAPGETGQIVVTPLHNLAMPLIRYAVGDYAEVGKACPCGRGLPVIKRVLGRVRNMLTLPSGDKNWPRLANQDYATITGAGIHQTQLVQQTIDKIEVRLVSDDVLSSDQEQKLIQFIQKTLGHPFNIIFSYHEKLQRNQGGKFEEFISAIEPG